MVKAKRKPFDEIKQAIQDYTRVLNVGCGGCVSVCLAGGQKEVNLLNAKLNLAFKNENRATRVDGFTVERQCNEAFLVDLDKRVPRYDCLMSMACHHAVRANRVMTIQEMETLIKDLWACENPVHCPHGRPTIVTFDKYRMEKLFKRVV